MESGTPPILQSRLIYCSDPIRFGLDRVLIGFGLDFTRAVSSSPTVKQEQVTFKNPFLVDQSIPEYSNTATTRLRRGQNPGISSLPKQGPGRHPRTQIVDQEGVIQALVLVGLCLRMLFSPREQN